jgi:hypothetical protein
MSSTLLNDKLLIDKKMFVIDKKMALQATQDGNWSPRHVLQSWVRAMKKSGYTLSVIGGLLGVRKQAVQQWEKPVARHMIHIERRALHRMLVLAGKDMNSVAPELRPWVHAVQKILSCDFSSNPETQITSIEWPTETSRKKVAQKHYVQVWIPQVLKKAIKILSETWIGATRGFHNWIVKLFLKEKPYQKNPDSYPKKIVQLQHRINDQANINHGDTKEKYFHDKWLPMSLRLDDKTFHEYRHECKKIGMTYGAFLYNAIEWIVSDKDRWSHA